MGAKASGGGEGKGVRFHSHGDCDAGAWVQQGWKSQWRPYHKEQWGPGWRVWAYWYWEASEHSHGVRWGFALVACVSNSLRCSAVQWARSGENLDVTDQLFEGKVIRVSIREGYLKRGEHEGKPWKVSAVQPEYIERLRKEGEGKDDWILKCGETSRERWE